MKRFVLSHHGKSDWVVTHLSRVWRRLVFLIQAKRRPKTHTLYNSFPVLPSTSTEQATTIQPRVAIYSKLIMLLDCGEHYNVSSYNSVVKLDIMTSVEHRYKITVNCIINHVPISICSWYLSFFFKNV